MIEYKMRIPGLVIAFLFFTTGIILTAYSRYVENYLFEELYIYLNREVYTRNNLPVHLIMHILFVLTGLFITFLGVSLIIYTLSYKFDIVDFFVALSRGFTRFTSLLLSGLLSTLLIYLTFLALITPKNLFNYGDLKQMAAAQILSCVGFAGMLGGVVKVVFSSKVIEDQTDMATFRVSFRKVLFNCIGSLFIACTSFLLIRAGVLKSVDVDTFNPYGVTGIAAVTGFFSDQIVSRLTTVYTNIFNVESPKIKPDNKD